MNSTSGTKSSAQPQYEDVDEIQSSAIYHDILPRLRRVQLGRRPNQSALKLNLAPDSELRETLEKVRGIGSITANKILTERWLNGDFLGTEDFNRRLSGVTFSRLATLCDENKLQISLAPSSRKMNEVGSESEITFDESFITRAGNSQRGTCITIATWNTAKLSTRSPVYGTKVKNLMRLIRDSEVDVLCLQEVVRGVVNDLIGAISKELGTTWMVYESKYLGNGFSDASLVILYKSTTVKVRGSLDHRIPNIRRGLCVQRIPQLAFVTSRDYKAGDHPIALLNVHLSQSNPRDEIGQTCEIAQMIEHFMSKHSEQSPFVITGDFNMNSDSDAFTSIRKAGFVELVRPASKQRSVAEPHAFKVLRSATTIGGQWFDNFWVQERARWRVCDAWCFNFGGRGLMLSQNGYEFAGKKRTECSDHFPVVVQIDISGA